MKETKNKGKGVFAKQFVPKGTIICFECSKCKKYPKDYPNKLPKMKKQYFLSHVYQNESGGFTMPCGIQKYINHSCNANMLDARMGFKEGFDIIVRNIKKGEELLYDYRVFLDDLDTFECKCGEKNCCKTMNCTSQIPKELESLWQNRVNAALKLVKKVNQPLRNKLLINIPLSRNFLS